jgi:3-oxoacyl-[acyl-carrier-protein] synthase II
MKYGIVPPTINHLTNDENIDSKLNFIQQSSKKER